MTFTANSEYLVGGGRRGVFVWRAHNGEQSATMNAWDVHCLAVSKDCRWIAAGTYGGVILWDARTYEKVLSTRADLIPIRAIDFSPDSTRLVRAESLFTVTIYDVPAGREVQTLRYLDSLGPGGLIVAVKYSPQGERIAAATENAVHVWDSNDGRLLISIKMQVSPWRRNRANDLLWFNNNIFVMSTDHKIKQIDASTGAVVSEWPITKDCSHIAMPHQTLIAYVAHDNDNVMFWDTSAHTHRHLIQTPKFIQSTAFSSDGQLLAIAAQLSGKITIKPLLSYIFVGFMYSSISAELN